MKKTTRKRALLRVVKETYGTQPMKETFRKALEPYFEIQETEKTMNKNRRDFEGTTD
ncbi:hypothetical protein [Melghirimyces algeriensis]|uniref:Uncharacterized protein n=1 Tax=Melghirimyces algeriensis TaxID=910412 RepID=A0A521AP15_9BACL|nr:hypothetical protein [Melghirimyces algeriensis]SMO36553.1 hypothetical protein SAMN06264849_101258 [Melghirimyces algeriensis]